jgi:NAD(P)-dependent dehydrogenase (short-subunit alcohol dehydrogenase family)
VSKIALVTGASGGVGREVCALLGHQGWTVIAVSREIARLELVSAQHKLAADVSNAVGAAAAIEQAQAIGAVSALVHCAGSTLIQAAHRTSVEQYRAVMAANADAAFFVLSRWANAMREVQQPGSAVLFSSVVARIGVANHEAIAAAKGAIEAMARSFAATYAPQRLRFNVLAPGMTDTPMTAAMLRSDAVREGAAKQYPLGSIGTASELAQMAAYLVSESAQRITGQIISVDGGFTAVRPLVR